MENKWIDWTDFQKNEEAVEDIIFTHETAKESLINSGEDIRVKKKSIFSFFNSIYGGNENGK